MERILVIGSLNADFVVQTSALPKAGESFIGDSFELGLGGKGANQAVAAARMGAQVNMVGKVGHDVFGEKMLTALKAQGIQTEYIQTVPDHATGSAFIILETSGQNRIISVPGANLLFSSQDVDAVAHLFDHTDMVLIQLEIDIHAVERAVELADLAGIPVILNPGPTPTKPLSDRMLSKLACITPNETEAEALTGMPIHDITDAKKAAKLLYDKGVKHVIITLGEKGVFVLNDQVSEWVPAVKVNAVDTVAAGDTFSGALTVELCRGIPLIEAVRFANAAAAITVTRMGAMQSIPQRNEVKLGDV